MVYLKPVGCQVATIITVITDTIVDTFNNEASLSVLLKQQPHFDLQVPSALLCEYRNNDGSVRAHENQLDCESPDTAVVKVRELCENKASCSVKKSSKSTLLVFTLLKFFLNFTVSSEKCFELNRNDTNYEKLISLFLNFCQVYANTRRFGNPCGSTYKYLEVEYECKRKFCFMCVSVCVWGGVCVVVIITLSSSNF